MAVVFVRQGASLSFFLEMESSCGKQSDQLLAAVETARDCADAVTKELGCVNVAVAEMRRHNEQAIIAENAP